jgi:hypothetical protein
MYYKQVSLTLNQSLLARVGNLFDHRSALRIGQLVLHFQPLCQQTV